MVALAVLGLEPIKAAVGIVGPLLLRQKQRKTIAVRKRRPSGSKIISCCGLGASVQHDNKCRIVCKGCRSILAHAEIAGIRSETNYFLQTCSAMACTSGTAAIQRPKDLLPPTAAIAEGVRLAQIYHCGSSPVAAIN